jgi:ATP/maltotriose-dependent transcriptional regulator MalT
LVLVVDDLHELEGASSAVRLVESLVRYAPATLHLVLASRHELPFAIVRMRGRGEVLQLDSKDLAFTKDDTATRLANAIESVDQELLDSLHDASGGWPAAVQLAAEMLAADRPGDRGKLLEALSRKTGPLFSYLAEEVFGREPPETQELLRTVTRFDRVTAELCEALGVADAGELLAELARRGLVAASPAGTGAWYTLHALVREFVLETWPTASAEVRELRRQAGNWFDSAGLYKEALESLTAAADPDGIVRLLDKRHRELVDEGALGTLVEAGAVLPVELRRHPRAVHIAHAHLLRGESSQALEWLSALANESDIEPSWLSFHIALVHISREEPRKALDVLLSTAATSRRELTAMEGAFIAYQLMALGRLDDARSHAVEALQAASDLPELTPRAEAHMAVGDIALEDGDLAAAGAHYDTAVEIAERIGNILATCSARTRRAALRIAQGRLREAVEDATHAVTLADRVGFSLFQAWAPMTRGDAYLALGHLDEAAADFAAALEVEERLGSNAISGPLVGLAAVYRVQGELAQSGARTSAEWRQPNAREPSRPRSSPSPVSHACSWTTSRRRRSAWRPPQSRSPSARVACLRSSREAGSHSVARTRKPPAPLRQRRSATRDVAALPA